MPDAFRTDWVELLVLVATAGSAGDSETANA
jgi:hypothetical protein